MYLGRRMGQRLVPAHFAPRIGDARAYHRLGHALAMRGVAPGEAALDAAMAVIGLAVLVRDHAHQLRAAHLRLELAADAAIRAGGDHRVLRRADLDDLFLDQRGGRASLHAGAAGHALAGHETLVLAGGDARIEAAAVHRQREGALHFLTGTHAAAAHDAFGRVVVEIRVGLVLRLLEVVGPLIAVAHVAQAHFAGGVLQLAIAVGAAGQAVQRMVGDVELHHALAQLGEPLVLGVDHHAVVGGRGARRRGATASLDLDQA